MLNDLVNVVLEKIHQEKQKPNPDLRTSNLGLNQKTFAEAIHFLEINSIVKGEKTQNGEEILDLTPEGKKTVEAPGIS